MSRSKIIAIVMVLIVVVITFVGSIFLVTQGIVEKEFMGLNILNWFQIIVGISIFAIILYDFINIRVKRKKYGELKYTLKRKDKRKQIIGFIFLLIMYFIETWIFTNGFKKFDSGVMFLMYAVAPLPLLFGYHNLEKEGLGEGGVYYWGDVIPWDKVLRFSFKDNILTIVGSKKIFGKNEMFDIPFIIEDIDRSEIEEFLGGRIESPFETK